MPTHRFEDAYMNLLVAPTEDRVTWRERNLDDKLEKIKTPGKLFFVGLGLLLFFVVSFCLFAIELLILTLLVYLQFFCFTAPTTKWCRRRRASLFTRVCVSAAFEPILSCTRAKVTAFDRRQTLKMFYVEVSPLSPKRCT